MIRRTKRTARKVHVCSCEHRILPGEPYLELVASPNHEDLGSKTWWRIAECYDCATRYGRMENE